MEDKILSKHYLDNENIRILYERAFNDFSDITISLLSGGVESAVYLIDNGYRKVVLKLEPKNSNTISVDKNTIECEIEMLKLMKKLGIPAPRLLFFDNSYQICDVSYFFMTYIKGKNYLEVKSNMDKSTINKIEYQLGELSSRITRVTSDRIILPKEPNRRFKDNYEFMLYLFDLLLDDAISAGLDFYDLKMQIYDILLKRKNSLNNVNKYSLCHTDLWDGNIIIDNGSISGIVDFSDLYYCDELMTFYFHNIDGTISQNFLKGYGKSILNYDEKIRIEIYRMYVILKMIVECKIKSFGKFEWMYDNLYKRLKKINDM